MIRTYGLHHSFDSDLATELKSVEQAILIHHFQYWIRHNFAMQKNQHDGRTWTYQTLEDISNHFPYWSFKQVRSFIDKLVDKDILIKGNYNKSAYDRTVWYAFKDEAKFVIPKKAQNPQLIPEKCPNGQMGMPEWENGDDQMGTPIPNTIPDTLPYSSSPPIPPHSPPPDPEPERAKAREMDSGVSKIYSEEVKKVAQEMVAILKTGKQNYKTPSNLTQWHQAIDLMIRCDEREPSLILKVFAWAVADEFWKDKMYKPNPPKYLRMQFEQLEIKMTTKPMYKRTGVDRRTKDKDGKPIELEPLF